MLSFLTKKWLTIFGKVLTPFWKTFLWLNMLKQLFDATQLIKTLQSFSVPKDYGIPTCVTRLKVAVNMADLISLNKNSSYPKYCHK